MPLYVRPAAPDSRRHGGGGVTKEA